MIGITYYIIVGLQEKTSFIILATRHLVPVFEILLRRSAKNFFPLINRFE